MAKLTASFTAKDRLTKTFRSLSEDAKKLAKNKKNLEKPLIIKAEDQTKNSFQSIEKQAKKMRKTQTVTVKANDQFSKPAKQIKRYMNQKMPKKWAMVIEAKDKATSVLQNIRRQSRRHLSRTQYLFIEAKDRATATVKKIGDYSKRQLSRGYNFSVRAIDIASKTVGRIASYSSRALPGVRSFTVKAVDSATRVVGSIKRSLFSIPGVITVTLAVVGVNKVKDATVGAAMNFEGYEVSMDHWLKGNKKKSQELITWMGQLADKTPFSSPDLFPALTRGIGLADGDVKQAKKMLTIATDMAALTPGSTVADAMEALGDAKMGEFERLKAFNMKMNKETYKQIGGYKGLLKEVDKTFSGGARKLSATSRGILSTLSGYRSSLFRSLGQGFLDPMKPRLDAISKWLDNNQDKWKSWKKTVMNAGEGASEFVFSRLESGFNHIRTNYLENDNFKKMDFEGKVKFIWEDVKESWGDKVQPKLNAWWEETGRPWASNVGGEMLGLMAGGFVGAIKTGFGVLWDMNKDTLGQLITDPFENFGKTAGTLFADALVVVAAANIIAGMTDTFGKVRKLWGKTPGAPGGGPIVPGGCCCCGPGGNVTPNTQTPGNKNDKGNNKKTVILDKHGNPFPSSKQQPTTPNTKTPKVPTPKKAPYGGLFGGLLGGPVGWGLTAVAGGAIIENSGFAAEHKRSRPDNVVSVNHQAAMNGYDPVKDKKKENPYSASNVMGMDVNSAMKNYGNTKTAKPLTPQVKSATVSGGDFPDSIMAKSPNQILSDAGVLGQKYGSNFVTGLQSSSKSNGWVQNSVNQPVQASVDGASSKGTGFSNNFTAGLGTSEGVPQGWIEQQLNQPIIQAIGNANAFGMGFSTNFVIGLNAAEATPFAWIQSQLYQPIIQSIGNATAFGSAFSYNFITGLNTAEVTPFSWIQESLYQPIIQAIGNATAFGSAFSFNFITGLNNAELTPFTWIQSSINQPILQAVGNATAFGSAFSFNFITGLNSTTETPYLWIQNKLNQPMLQAIGNAIPFGSAFATNIGIGINSTPFDILPWIQQNVNQPILQMVGNGTAFGTGFVANLIAGVNSMSGAAHSSVMSLGNTMISGLAKVLNGLTSGVNSVMGGLGVTSKLPTWSPPKYARGTKGHPEDGPAIVGDGGMPELMRFPNGHMALSPNRDTLVNMPRGTEVLSGPRTKSLLNGGIPAYKDGIGFEDVGGAFQGKLGDVFEYMDSPDRLINDVLKISGNKLPDIRGAFGDMSKGALSLVKTKMTEWVSEKFAEFGGIDTFDGLTRTSGYGMRGNPFGGGSEFHKGIDFAGPLGTPIRANVPGKVIKTGYGGAGSGYNGYGNVVALSSGLYTHLYAHLQSVLAKVGQQVSAGQVIGKLGSTGNSTGPHLHYEVRKAGTMQTVNPEQFLGGGALGGGGAGVQRWAGLATKALQMTGQYSSANLKRMLMQMDTESSGNPKAINLWDSNAKKGIPSKGLMQVIDPTFRANAMPGYNKNVYDPLSNMLASIRYSLKTYGSLGRAWRGVGYEKGGVVGNDQIARLGEGNKREVVIPLQQHRDRALGLLGYAQQQLGVDDVLSDERADIVRSSGSRSSSGKVSGGIRDIIVQITGDSNYYDEMDAEQVGKVAVKAVRKAIEEEYYEGGEVVVDG